MGSTYICYHLHILRSRHKPKLHVITDIARWQWPSGCIKMAQHLHSIAFLSIILSSYNFAVPGQWAGITDCVMLVWGSLQIILQVEWAEFSWLHICLYSLNKIFFPLRAAGWKPIFPYQRKKSRHHISPLQKKLPNLCSWKSHSVTEVKHQAQRRCSNYTIVQDPAYQSHLARVHFGSISTNMSRWVR